jgi:hypothetical protein
MPFTREQLRESFERAGFDEHWQALNRHHTDAYPESNPTPGQVASAEASRLNELGLGDNPDLRLVESRVERVEPAVRITHVFEDRSKALGSRPSRSLATNRRGLGTRIVMRRGRHLRAALA